MVVKERRTEKVDEASKQAPSLDALRGGVLLCVFNTAVGEVCSDTANYIAGGASYCWTHLKLVDPEQEPVRGG